MRNLTGRLMPQFDKTTLIVAADANYFHLLQDAVLSIKGGNRSSRMPLSVLDLGLTKEQVGWLESQGATIARAQWDFDFPGQDVTPGYFKAMTARPYLRNYFPGFETYFWLDSDAWIQDDTVIDYFLRGAEGGKLAIVPEIDRSYSNFYKRPRRYSKTQNYRAFRWSYGWKVADRLGRNPILNSGVFALASDAPHWDLWASALKKALRRWRLKRGINCLNARISEQTALNYVVFGDKAPATFLPAYCNWFCGKGAPMYNAATQELVEPHEPHRPLGIVHLAGDGVQDKVFDLTALDGPSVKSKLTFEAINSLKNGSA